MFCYAMARRLSWNSGLPLRLDLETGFCRDPYQRCYMLDLFRTQQTATGPNEGFSGRLGEFRRRVCRNVTRLQPLHRRRYLCEEVKTKTVVVHGVPCVYSQKVFDSQILNLQPRQSVYVDGLWQDARYFADIDAALRNEFSPDFVISPEVLSAVATLRTQESVCVHVRMFQELTVEDRKLANAGMGVTSLQYYRKALAAIRAKVKNPVLYLFSETPDLARKIMPEEAEFHFVQSHASDVRKRAVEEFWLMSNCRHFVSPQSTFCWWAAWLSDNAKKIITVPNCGSWRDYFHYQPPGLSVIEQPFTAE